MNAYKHILTVKQYVKSVCSFIPKFTNINTRNPFSVCLYLLLSNVFLSAQPIDDIYHCSYSKKVNQANYVYKINPHQTKYNLLHTRLTLSVNPAIRYIDGIATHTFKTTQIVDTLVFDITDSLLIDSVVYHQSQVMFNRVDNKLYVPLLSSVAIGVTDSITIHYSGIPPQTGFGSFAQATHAGVPVVWTLSEPYGARDWWPCKMGLVDKIDSIDIIIKTPVAYKAASNGLLVSELENLGVKTYHWKSTYPIETYLVAFAVTNYTAYYDYYIKGTDTVKILNYVYPEDFSSAQQETKEVVKHLHLFDSLFIPYPFKNEKYGHAQFSWGGGIEHQTMSFMANFSKGLLAHELAHQWFGDYVTCGSWQDIWLNEGFATYLEGLTKQYLYKQEWVMWKQNRLSAITSVLDGSVWCIDTNTVANIFNGRLSYSKGAYLLHMARWVAGDSVFFTAVKNYLMDTTIQYAYSRTAYLISYLETTSGKSFQTFFNQWFYGEGFPSYTVNWKFKENVLTLIVEQATSHSSVSFFEMPIPIYIKGAAGKDTMLVLEHSYSGQQFEIPISFVPKSVQFDPDLWILSANNKVNRLTDSDSKILIYPNPIIDELTLEWLEFEGPILSIELVNMLGQRLYEWYGTIAENAITIKLPIVDRGAYYLRVVTSNGSVTQKINKIE